MRYLVPVVIGWAGVLCGEGNLHAAVIYRDFADIELNPLGGRYEISLDVDLNGVDDLTFVATPDCPSGCSIYIRVLNGSTIGQSIPYQLGFRYAERIAVGARVDESADYIGTGAALQRSMGPNIQASGPWNQSLDPAFIPFTMLISGSTHFGWIRAQGTSTQFTQLNARIFDIAYEDSPFTPINAGTVPTPGAAVLALVGLIPFSVRRRRVRRI